MAKCMSKGMVINDMRKDKFLIALPMGGCHHLTIDFEIVRQTFSTHTAARDIHRIFAGETKVRRS